MTTNGRVQHYRNGAATVRADNPPVICEIPSWAMAVIRAAPPTRPPMETFALYEGIDRPHAGVVFWLSVLDAFGLGLIVGGLAW